jgi:hypothetical protein
MTPGHPTSIEKIPIWGKSEGICADIPRTSPITNTGYGAHSVVGPSAKHTSQDSPQKSPKTQSWWSRAGVKGFCKVAELFWKGARNFFGLPPVLPPF